MSPYRYGRPPKFKIYKDKFYVVNCKLCGKRFYHGRYNWKVAIGLCYTHRYEYYKKRYREYYIPYFNALPQEKQREIKKSRQIVWRLWVVKNPDKRRKQSLQSYYRRKTAIGGAEIGGA